MDVFTERDTHGFKERVQSDDSRLGRIYVEDKRDQDYLIEDALPDRVPRQLESSQGVGSRWRYWWPHGWWGNQGDTPECVAYSWLHLVDDGPTTWGPFDWGEGPVESETAVYNRAQDRDRWPGDDYDGTSVRAGAKVLKELGYIKEYRWAWDAETVIQAILKKGPVLLGSWWYKDMFYPDEDGMIRVSGGRVGGHAYVVNGVNRNRGIVRIKNSWGREWGKNGFAYMTFGDLDKLIKDQGEACLPIEAVTEESRS